MPVKGPLVQLPYGGTDAVEKISVVGYDYDALFRVPEIILQVCDGPDVQMVGGLIQEHQPGIGSEGACYGHLLEFASGKL